jgi:hypothetical protein
MGGASDVEVVEYDDKLSFLILKLVFFRKVALIL